MRLGGASYGAEASLTKLLLRNMSSRAGARHYWFEATIDLDELGQAHDSFRELVFYQLHGNNTGMQRCIP